MVNVGAERTIRLIQDFVGSCQDEELRQNILLSVEQKRKVFICLHYSLSIKREIDRCQLKFQILTLLNASMRRDHQKVKAPRNWSYSSTCKIYTDSMHRSRQGASHLGKSSDAAVQKYEAVRK